MIIDWNPLVNTKFSLEESISLEEGFIEELTFDSGKKRTWLRNSFVPRIFPSLNLLLDNKTSLSGEFDEGKTEFEEFEEWFNRSLRYGTFSFLTAQIGFRKKWDTKIPAMGVYKFLGAPEYDRLKGSVLATFSLEEEAVTPEVKHTLLVSNNGKVLLINNGSCIAVE